MTWIDWLVLVVIFSALVTFGRMWWRSRRGLSAEEVTLVGAASLLLRVWLAVRQHDHGEISGEELVRLVKSKTRTPEATEALARLMVMSRMAQLTTPTAIAAEDFREGRIDAADFMAVVEKMFEIRE
jgi:hypothetical protein